MVRLRIAPQAELVGFADRLNVEHKRKRGVEGGSKIFALSDWWDGAAIF